MHRFSRPGARTKRVLAGETRDRIDAFSCIVLHLDLQEFSGTFEKY